MEHLPEAKDDDLEQIMAENLASRLAPSGVDLDDDTQLLGEVLDAEDGSVDDAESGDKFLVLTPTPPDAAAGWWPPHRTTVLSGVVLVGLSLGVAAGYRSELRFADLGAYLSLDKLSASREHTLAALPSDDLAASLRQAKIGFEDKDEATVTATNNIDTDSLDSLKGLSGSSGGKIPVRMASLGNPSAAAAAARPQARQIDKAEADKLIERGKALMQLGQLSSARLMFKRAADGGDPRGARMMGQTYDPVVFRTIPVAGLAPDREKAEFWYERSETMPAIFATTSRN